MYDAHSARNALPVRRNTTNNVTTALGMLYKAGNPDTRSGCSSPHFLVKRKECKEIRSGSAFKEVWFRHLSGRNIRRCEMAAETWTGLQA